MDIVNNQNDGKSLDTLVFEYEEQEMYKKYRELGESFISESQNLDNESNNDYLTPKAEQEYGSIVIRNNAKDKVNLRNLKKQFTCTDKIPVTRRENSDQLKQQDIKTTATTSRRKQHEEVKQVVKGNKFESRIDNVELNQFMPAKKLPFDYMEISMSKDQMSKPETENNGVIMEKNQGDNSIFKIHSRIPSSYNKQRPDSVPDSNAKQVGNELIIESVNFLSDAFAGILDAFLPQESDDDGNLSIASCFGCGKKSARRNKMITPRSRRVRATSQFRMNNDNYFKIGKSNARSKSKEFLNNDIVTQMIKDHSSRSRPVNSEAEYNPRTHPAESK